MPAQRTGTRSRQQHSRNLGSKKGNVFKVSSHSKTMLSSVVHTKTAKTRVYVAKAEKTKIHDNDADVVVAKPPKAKKGKKAAELRFTIPNVPENNDLIAQSYNRTHDGLKNVIRELKTCLKVRTGATDPEHVEMISQ